MTKTKDISGQKFGRLTAIKRLRSDKNRHSVWLCKCECGNYTEVTLNALGKTTNSCGCLHKEHAQKLNKSHGKSDTILYGRWLDMKKRCNNPSYKQYKDYGGRGISICEDWGDFENFYKWAIENGFQEDLEIDRIDNNGDYCPENCHWVTSQEQNNNRRDNHLITYQGETKTMAQWARDKGITYGLLENRLNKLDWSIERALTEPIRRS